MAAGDVVRCDIAVNAPMPPVIAEVTPDPDLVVVATPYTRQLTLTQGTADAWTLIQGPAGATVEPNGYVHGWTPAAGQAGQLIGFTARATNALGSDEESWQVQVSIFKSEMIAFTFCRVFDPRQMDMELFKS